MKTRPLRILTEASGGLTAGFLINAIRDSGHTGIASDITFDSVGRFLADEFIKVPVSNDPSLWDSIYSELEMKKIDIVIPSLDETLLGWAQRKEELASRNIHVICSPTSTIEIFVDKWLTYEFFLKNNIPTPNTSQSQEFSLLKPRFGRGGKGVGIVSHNVSMEGLISQQFVNGVEYTIDVFCDLHGVPIYIIPRKRLKIEGGKSTSGVVDMNQEIIEWVREICSKIRFTGPINIQCIRDVTGQIFFIEINPRIAGGMALGFAASENWIPLIVANLVHKMDIVPVKVMNEMKMMRYYAEIFTV